MTSVQTPEAASSEPRGTGGSPRSPVPLRPPWDRRRITLATTIVAVAAVTVLSVRDVGLSPGALVDGFGDIRNLADRMLPPRLEGTDHVLAMLAETFHMALLGTLLAVSLSLPIAFLAASNTTPNRVVQAGARGLITACRAIPDLVFALIFVRALGLGVLPGVLALGLHSIGMLGKLFADAIEEIDEGPREAVLATGASRVQAISAAVLPQIVPSVIGTGLYRLDINIRSSAVLGYVGAGGIGQELRATLGNLRYQEALGIVALIFGLIVVMEAVSVAVRRTLLGGEGDVRRDASVFMFLARRQRRRPPSVATLTPVAPSALSPPWTVERRYRAGYSVLLAGLVVLGLQQTGISPIELLTSLDDVWRVVERFFPPDFSSQRNNLVEFMLETVAIGVSATVIGVLLAVPLALLAASNVAPARWVYLLARYGIVALRGVPEFILAVVFVAALGLGPFPGALALGIGTAGFMAKLLADALEEVAQGPMDAVDATGASRSQQTAAAVVPQVVPALVGHALYMLDVNIRSSVVLGIVGAGGIGFLLVQSVRTFDFQLTSAILIAIFVVVYAIEQLSGWLRRALI